MAGTAAALILPASAKTCAPESYGAKHDGVALDTSAIQKAIDACGAGDRIVLGRGVYLSGPLTLGSGDTFVVEKGAMLKASADHALFQLPGGGKPQPLIAARQAHDITLSGEGVIDGNGLSWWTAFKAARAVGGDYGRPYMIRLTHIRNLKVSGLTLQNSPMFHLVPEFSSNVLVENLTIRVTAAAPKAAPNTDGIDPSGRDMIFRNLNIDVGDDNIAIKSGRNDPQHPGEATANLVVRDCVFRHGHGLSIGSETNGGVRNLLAENISFEDTDNAIRVKTNRSRGGPIRDLVYRNIAMKNVGNAILITNYYPDIPQTDTAKPVTALTPRISGVRIENVKIDGAKTAGGFYGLPESPLENIVLDGVTASAHAGMTTRYGVVRMNGRVEAQTGAALIEQTGGKFEVLK